MRNAAAVVHLDTVSKSTARVFEKARRLTATLDRMVIAHSGKRRPDDLGGANDGSAAATRATRKYNAVYGFGQRKTLAGDNAIARLEHTRNQHFAALELRHHVSSVKPIRRGEPFSGASAMLNAPVLGLEPWNLFFGSNSVETLRLATQAVRNLTRPIREALATGGRRARSRARRIAQVRSQSDRARLTQTSGRMNRLSPGGTERSLKWFGVKRRTHVSTQPRKIGHLESINYIGRSIHGGRPQSDRVRAATLPRLPGASGSFTAPIAVVSASAAMGRLIPSPHATPTAFLSPMGTRANGFPASTPPAGVFAQRPTATSAAIARTANRSFNPSAVWGEQRARRGTGEAPRQSLSLNYSPTIIIREGYGAADFDRRVTNALSEHSRDLLQVLGRELSRRSRTQF